MRPESAMVAKNALLSISARAWININVWAEKLPSKLKDTTIGTTWATAAVTATTKLTSIGVLFTIFHVGSKKNARKQ